jgi:hypothetical protein
MICYPGRLLGTTRLQRMRDEAVRAHAFFCPGRLRLGRAGVVSLLFPWQLMGAQPFFPLTRPGRWRPPPAPPMGSEPIGVGLGFFSFPFFALWSVGTPLTRVILRRGCRLPPAHATCAFCSLAPFPAFPFLLHRHMVVASSRSFTLHGRGRAEW